VLDIIKDRVDGTLAYRKSCRMMICGSCGMRMDGGAVLACKERMKPIVDAGHVPVISAMGNLPIIKDLVVDMGPFWAKTRSVRPWLEPGYVEPPAEGGEYLVSQEEMNVVHKESLCIQCGCCVSECNSMESDPEFLGPAALAKAMRFVGDPRDQTTVERLDSYNGEHGIWDCTRCYFCNQRCPKGVDPRDAIAKLGAEIYSEGMLSDKGARHAQVFDVSTRTTGYLLETALVPYTDPLKAMDVKFALNLARAGKVPNPLKSHKAPQNDEVKRLWKLLEAEGKNRADDRPLADHPSNLPQDRSA
jgi:succinate dehydrogenase / fumarate reductase iron-sulfur subunit